MCSSEYPQRPTIATIYRQRWGEGESPPDLEPFLSEFADLPLLDLVEVLITDQRLRWQWSAGPSVEDYLHRFPAVAVDRDATLDLIYGEMLAACALGLPLDFDAYGARFPDLRGELHRQMEVTQWLNDAVRHAETNRSHDQFR
jgi:hypothetical protein